MATLRCRACGTHISSDARRTRCTCGELFPLECSVCARPLRPPLSVFPDERHISESGAPLCEEHYQRQCPDCGDWFRADENPGYFRCAACAAAHEAARSAPSPDELLITAPHAARDAAKPRVAPHAPPQRKLSRASSGGPQQRAGLPFVLVPACFFGAAILYGVWQLLHR